MTSLTDETYKLFDEAYAFFNSHLFGDELPICLITFQRQVRLMGYASFQRWTSTEQDYIDELAINPEYFANFPVTEIFQTLCHEMVHIWQHHFGSPSRSGYHNKEWAQKMIDIGLMPSTTGRPGGDIVGERMMDYVIEDGPFTKACQTLLERGFQIKWLDAYPIANRHAPATPSSKMQMAQLGRQVDQITAAIPAPDQRPEPSLPYTDQELQAAFEASLEEAATVQPGLRLETTRPRNKSNRNKYYCAGCYAQVWGKPGLNIQCGNCDRGFVEAD
ncbi:SprT-like domain-containing protein [Alcanivorax sp.]|jgi:hypothetical protein|uniref:SprT-like domain-containing protein n=1 Tax=Alcanivorax sp. TaxID=1872427 RepID=UPI0026337D07|nr:SprT-like domain-containing protein [Alcanivorax sp.]|tara:strand:- start:3772 stop:4596 length:825 start_codon:yes stop_codon:yes gene_type:complete